MLATVHAAASTVVAVASAMDGAPRKFEVWCVMYTYTYICYCLFAAKAYLPKCDNAEL